MAGPGQSIMAAIINDDEEAVIEYLEQSGNPDLRKDSYSLLGKAAELGRLRIAEVLLSYECSSNCTSGHKRDTPLILALKKGHVQMAKLILDEAPDCRVNAFNRSGATALMAAARNNCVEIMRLLLKRGARTDIETKHSKHTALTMAVAKAHLESVQLLLEYGANPFHKTCDNKNAIDIAWEISDSENGGQKRPIVELLMQRANTQKECQDAIGCDDDIINDRYKVIKVIGSGSFGRVLVVRDMLDSEESVKAVKTIPMPENVESWTSIEEGEHEAHLMKRIKHPGIVRIFDYFDFHRSYCIVMEHCDLGDLNEWTTGMRREGILPPVDLTIHWFLQILLAVNYLHSNKIMHRDLKPKNVFLKSDATIRIGDFGLSRRLMSSSDYANTFTGTYRYLSPEIFKNEPYETKSDIWALGCIFYEISTCRSLFRGSPADIKEKVLRGRIEKLPSDIPKDLSELWYDSIMHRNRNLRATAAQLLKCNCIRRELRRMDTASLKSDQSFLSENRLNVLSNEDSGFSVDGSSDSASYQSFDSTLRSVIGDILDDKDPSLIESNNTHELKSNCDTVRDAAMPRLRQKEKAGFPLQEVTELLHSILREPPEKKRRKLRQLTDDLEACELVEMLIISKMSDSIGSSESSFE